MERDPHVVLIDEAIDRLLTIRFDLAPLTVAPAPELALDAVLAAQSKYIAAKVKADDALAAVIAALPRELRHLALELEACLRDEGAIIADVAFSVGLTAATGSR